MIRKLRRLVPGLIALIALSQFTPTVVRAASGQPFTTLDPTFTQALYGHVDFTGLFGYGLGGVAFAPNGDLWANNCNPGLIVTPFHQHQYQFGRRSVVLEHDTVVHVMESDNQFVGACAWANDPNGSVYASTGGQLATFDPTTGAFGGFISGSGASTGEDLAIDPQTGKVVTSDIRCLLLNTPCPIRAYDPASNTNGVLTNLNGISAPKGLAYDPSGKYLLLAIDTPTSELGIVDRSGNLIGTIPMTSKPFGVAVYPKPFFVVTNNQDGTMTRFDFPNDDLTQVPTLSTFASGGHFGTTLTVGPDQCLYAGQKGTNFLDGTTNGDGSIVQICPGPTLTGGKPGFVMVALGDSYSSGEGAPPFEDGSNYIFANPQENTYTFGGGNGCHRSLTNYAKLSAPIINPTALLIDRSCSGALINPAAGDPKAPIVPTAANAGATTQVDEAVARLSTAGGFTAADVNLVSVTMGGNDAGFAKTIAACMMPNLADQMFNQYQALPGTSEPAGEVMWLIQNFPMRCATLDLLFGGPAKRAALQAVEQEAQGNLANGFPNAKVLQLTYPTVVPNVADFAGDSCGGILRSDATYARSVNQAVNTAVIQAGSVTSAANSRFSVLDETAAFGANPLCPADPSQALVNGVDQGALNAVAASLVAPGSQSRMLLDAVNQAYINWSNCLINPLCSSLPLLLVLNQKVSDLGNFFTPAEIATLQSQLAPGATPTLQADNAKNLFHPNAVGYGVTACNVTAFYTNAANTCTPTLGGVLTYLFNGVTMSTTQPQVLTPGAPVPFQFNGFDPGTGMTVTGHSGTPIDLGTFIADAHGVVSGNITLPAGIDPGVHSLQFSGTNHQSPRTIQILASVAGNPRPGGAYGVYYPGFSADSQVGITVNGQPAGSIHPDDTGGVFATVPVPLVGSFTIQAKGVTTGKTSTQTVTTAPFNWTVQHPANSPEARNDAGMAYDPVHNQTVMFGGSDSNNVQLGSTWIWNGTTWTRVFPVHHPSARYGINNAMAWDPALGQIVLFGGRTLNGAYSNETWAWNGTDWAQLASAIKPAGREHESLTFDPNLNGILMFGGSAGTTTPFGDTWELTASGWTQLHPATSPSARARMSMAYDPSAGETILFGGYDVAYRNDTWAWKNGNWTRLTTPTAPAPRTEAAIAYDPAIGGLVIFGGQNDHGIFGDTWVFDGSNWTQQYTPVAPSRRYSPAMAFGQSGQLVLFGGDEGSTKDDETWTGAPGA